MVPASILIIVCGLIYLSGKLEDELGLRVVKATGSQESRSFVTDFWLWRRT